MSETGPSTGSDQEQSVEPEVSDSSDAVVFEPHARREPRAWANIFAGLAFACALVITVALMAVTGLFGDEDNRRTVLVWITLPMVLTFGSWMAVQSGRALLRVVVWISVLFVGFFIWIAVFSIGPYYIPVLILLLLTGFAPWPGSKPELDPPADLPLETEAQILGTTIVGTILDGVTKK